MTLKFTKFNNGIQGGNAKFDVDKFDYSTTSDGEFSSVPSDYISIEEEVGSIYTLKKYTKTEDDMGTLSNITVSTNQKFPGIIQDITSKDRQILPIGLAVTGDRKLFTRPKLEILSGGVAIEEYSLKEGDIFTDNDDQEWRVVKTPKEWNVSDNEIYRIHIIRRIGLEGSS